jgi:hypothetical protein
MDKPTMSKSIFMLASSLLSPKRRATNRCYARQMAVHTTPPYAQPLKEEGTDDASAQLLTSSEFVTQEEFNMYFEQLTGPNPCGTHQCVQGIIPLNDLITCHAPIYEAHLNIVPGAHLPPEPTTCFFDG